MSVKLPLYNQEGKKTGTYEVPESLFDEKPNNSLVHQAYTVKLANGRKNYAHTKTRADVRGGGIKPWRQKGTGRARHGSIRSPLWIGGGVTFGPRNERVYKKRLNKKMNRKAISIVLSSKAREGNVFVVDPFVFNEPKTKQGIKLLNALDITGISTVLYGASSDINFPRVFNNIPKVNVRNIVRINIVDLLHSQKCIFSKTALDSIVAQRGTPVKAAVSVKAVKPETKKAESRKR